MLGTKAIFAILFPLLPTPGAGIPDIAAGDKGSTHGLYHHHLINSWESIKGIDSEALLPISRSNIRSRKLREPIHDESSSKNKHHRDDSLKYQEHNQGEELPFCAITMILLAIVVAIAWMITNRKSNRNDAVLCGPRKWRHQKYESLLATQATIEFHGDAYEQVETIHPNLTQPYPIPIVEAEIIPDWEAIAETVRIMSTDQAEKTYTR